MGHFNDQYLDDCDRRTSDDDLLDRRDGVSSAPRMFTQPIIDTEIKYNRFNRDYDCFVDSRYVGSRPTYTAGDTLVRQVAADLIVDGLALTAAELDGGAEPPVLDPLPEQPGDQYPGVDYEEEQCACGALAIWEVPFTTEPHYEYFCDTCFPSTYYMGDKITPRAAVLA